MTKLRLLTKNLLDDLKRLAAEADTIYWMTAFMMKSGVNEVLPVLRDASMREHLQVRSVSIVRPTTEEEETAFAASLGLPAVRPDVHDRTD